MKHRIDASCFVALIALVFLPAVGYAELKPNARTGLWSSMQLKRITPLELIAQLKKDKESRVWQFDDKVYNWVTLSDVRALSKRLDSTVPCARVFSILNSGGAPSLSTERVEAAHLISAYRKGFYPLVLSTSKESDERLVKTAKEWLRTLGTAPSVKRDR